MEQRIIFNTKDRPEFVKELRSRVNSYFKENNISKNANANMVIKTIAMLAIYFVPYFLVVFNAFENSWLVLSMWILMGIGMAGIGFSIMHDANHGSYSKNQNVNKYLGYLINIIGGSSVNWRIQHNVLHHTYTNIHGHDEDLNSDPLMRFSPEQKRRKAHRFQQFYAWFLYGLITISWSIKKDFIQLERYKGKDLLKTQGISYKQAFIKLVFAKLFYYSFILVIPLIFSSQLWWLTLIFYFLMHFACGVLISVTFQLAHVVTEASFPKANEAGTMENNWAIHQLYTTANFARKNFLITWFVGGLNYQIEHHLFPNICHIHYRKISKIVRKTANDFQLPYHQSSLFQAIASHTRLLAKLGRYDTI